MHGFSNHARINFVKPCRSSHIEGSLVTGRPPSSVSGPVHENGGLVDYDMLEKTATLFRPKLIIAGASAYPPDFDYPHMRKIADAVGAFLMMDMAHLSGLVAASVVGDPFEYCDIVTTTTHKSLRDPRGGKIFFKKDPVLGVDLESAINNAVFPGLQGLDGARVEKILDMASITLNKNSVPGDKSALVPGGIRIGSPAMTTRGFTEKEFIAVADFIHEGVQITHEAKQSVKGSKLQDFIKFVTSPNFSLLDKVSDLRGRVEALTTQFPIPRV
ncbi:hypothetical protein LWI29_011431 [Acer saccharum]|uniref:Serine hydroxymethyltransferase-like domain-containing protein n=1 Tax=Acer saccharum TaxID=4024 RepID=A0AA39UHQ1_ACESA|nr:hypothetical protein LWI29_011431 [Acer saccharum]